MASRKDTIYRVIVFFQALEILHVDFASEKSRCFVYDGFRLAIRLSFCEFIFLGEAKKKICIPPIDDLSY